MPKLRTETFGPVDQSWLGSTHGLRNARTGIIDLAAFTKATHYPDGYIKSGFPVALVGGKYVPYDVTVGTTTGAGVLAGHILTDQQVVGAENFAAPIFDHGRVKIAKVATILANFAAPIAAKNATNIVYI